MTPTASSKTLESMPEAVRQSCLHNRRAFSTFAAVVCGTEEKLGVAAYVLAGFSWWTVVWWLIVWFLPTEAFVRGIPTFERVAVLGFAITFAMNLISHFLGVVAWVPRAEKGWPALGDAAATEGFRMLAAPILVLSALLFASVFLKTHGAASGVEHLPAAIETLLLGSAALYLYVRPLTYGYRVPNDREVDTAAARRRASLQASATSKSDTQSTSDDYGTPIEPRKARFTFADIDGMQDVKDKLFEPAQAIVAVRDLNAPEDPRNGFLLHGDPGNGKSTFGEALAGQLNVPFLELTYGDVASKWIGETPRTIVNCFALAKRCAPCVFLIDELDSFIPKRDGTTNNSEEQKITNTILTELTDLRRHRVVLVGATNFLSKLDAAATREGRWDYKIEIGPPDEPGRIGILRKAANAYAPGVQIDDSELVAIAARWNGFSVARLQAVAKAVPAIVKGRQKTDARFDDWIAALRAVQGRNNHLPTHAKNIADLVLEPATREALELIAGRLKDAYRIEAMGGTLPNGVLFSGPSGTGKTEAARALAKACDWAFISTSGPDLIADRAKLQSIVEEARDRRPAIIFIDEAEDLLRSRQFSTTPDLTNKLLTILDGAEEKVKDVMVIAATNHPDQIDPALLRAGRFTEKVVFAPPQSEEVPRFVATWLKGKKVGLEPGFDAFDIAHLCEGQTIANIQGALQYAINKAIHRHAGEAPLVLRREDISAALVVVLGGETS